MEKLVKESQMQIFLHARLRNAITMKSMRNGLQYLCESKGEIDGGGAGTRHPFV